MYSLRTIADTKLKYLCIICCEIDLSNIIEIVFHVCIFQLAEVSHFVSSWEMSAQTGNIIALYKHKRVGRIWDSYVNPMSVYITCFANTGKKIAIAFINNFHEKKCKTLCYGTD